MPHVRHVPVHLVHDASAKKYEIRMAFTIFRACTVVDRPFRPSRKVRAENHGRGRGRREEGGSIRRFARREGKLARPETADEGKRKDIKEGGREELCLSLFLSGKRERERERERERGSERDDFVRARSQAYRASESLVNFRGPSSRACKPDKARPCACGCVRVRSTTRREEEASSRYRMPVRSFPEVNQPRLGMPLSRETPTDSPSR